LAPGGDVSTMIQRRRPSYLTRSDSIYCGGEHVGGQYPSHDNDGAAHGKDKNEKRESSDDELHGMPLGEVSQKVTLETID
jgi:hypothetical protein